MSKEQFENIVKRVLGLTEVKDDMNPQNVKNWDSFSHMELVSQLEAEFGLHLEVDEITAMDNILAIKNILKNHGINVF